MQTMKKISNWIANEFHAWLAGVISWEEKALAILNGPALKYAAFAAAFVMRIPWLTGIPGIDIVYSCLVLLGVDVQYIACVRNAVEATGKGARAWWIFVSVLLALPVFQTNAVFTLHTQTGIPELAAMDVIRLSPSVWALECSALLVLLIAVSVISRPKHHAAPVVVAPAPSPAPTAPDKPRGSSTRRNTGRTVGETEALKAKVRPQVIKLAQAKVSQRDIVATLKAQGLDVTQFMVREIINGSKAKQQRKVS